MNLHSVRITNSGGRVIFTRVYLDGQEVRGVVAVHLEAGIGANPRSADEVLVTMTIAPRAVEVDTLAGLTVLDHRRSWRRLPAWVYRRSWRTRLTDAWTALSAR